MPCSGYSIANSFRRRWLQHHRFLEPFLLAFLCHVKSATYCKTRLCDFKNRSKALSLFRRWLAVLQDVSVGPVIPSPADMTPYGEAAMKTLGVKCVIPAAGY
jgi:hypothetical protein